MIKTFSISINEIDDVNDALKQLFNQFDVSQLLNNTIGIISCHADFITSGVYAKICETLKFDIVGTTTMSSSVKGCEDSIVLSLTVLTSDDVYFSNGISEEIFEIGDGNLEEVYKSTAMTLPGEPSLILSYAPLLLNVGGDAYIKALNTVSNGIPNFGTIAVDHNDDYHESLVLFNGFAYHNRYVFTLVCGNINPEFYVASTSNKSMFQEKCVVTSAAGSLLKTVNNIPIRDFMVQLGFQKNADGSITGISSFPFIIDFNDGTIPIVRAMLAVTPEGYGVCGGDVPVGSTLSFGLIDNVEVMDTTEKQIQNVADAKKHSFYLIYSCIGRFYALSYDTMAEINKVASVLEGTNSNYHFAYSGCELCPVYTTDSEKKTINRCHNDTLIICAM